MNFLTSFQKSGFAILRNCIDKQVLSNLTKESIDLLNRSFINLRLELSNNFIHANGTLSELYSDASSNIYHGLLQRNFNVYRLMTSSSIFQLCIDASLKQPYINSDPLLMVHAPMADNAEFKTTSPWHQDWLSMQGSVNSVVVWIPLTPINDPQSDGGITLLESSHNGGLYSSSQDSWFASIDDINSLTSTFPQVTPSFDVGDVLIFSSLLVHRTVRPISSSSKVRFSLQFRYSDYSCPILQKNNWYYNYDHCVPLRSQPPQFKP